MPPKDRNLHLSLFSAKENFTTHQHAAICPKSRNLCEKVFPLPTSRHFAKSSLSKRSPPFREIDPLTNSSQLTAGYFRAQDRHAPSATAGTLAGRSVAHRALHWKTRMRLACHPRSVRKVRNQPLKRLSHTRHSRRPSLTYYHHVYPTPSDFFASLTAGRVIRNAVPLRPLRTLLRLRI